MKRNRETVVACGLRGAHPPQRGPDRVIHRDGGQTRWTTISERPNEPVVCRVKTEVKQSHTSCQTVGNQKRSPSSRHCMKPEEVTVFAISLHLRELFSVSRLVLAASVHFSRSAFCPPRSVTLEFSASRSVPSWSANQRPVLRVPAFRTSAFRVSCGVVAEEPHPFGFPIHFYFYFCHRVYVRDSAFERKPQTEVEVNLGEVNPKSEI